MILSRKTLVLFGLLSLASSAASAGGEIERGKELATKTYNCTTCHGTSFNNPIDPSYPKLAGQHYTYLVHALAAYKDGHNPMMGRDNPIMGVQAKDLTEDQMHDIAAYLASLPESVQTHK